VFEWLGVRNEPHKAGLIAVLLWTIFAVVVWNVVFDRVVVLAGREFVYAAYVAAASHQPYLRIDAWMRPAVVRAARLATYAAAVVLAVGAAAITVAMRREVATERRRSAQALAAGAIVPFE
jgi:hypothetical protein